MNSPSKNIVRPVRIRTIWRGVHCENDRTANNQRQRRNGFNCNLWWSLPVAPRGGAGKVVIAND
ncbi:hypothetical protein RHEC894_CH01770 [Rhizobium sp. CIAT894]|nr:hypothetical protein RHEC894_CH01770 [Rhizobium sp. CIAT894]